MPESIHDKEKYHDNRCESSHEPTRVRERQMRKVKSREQANRFLRVFSSVYNLFNLQRHLCSAHFYKIRRTAVFGMILPQLIYYLSNRRGQNRLS
ncbi:DDE-type integrase/transposase/recombinase [Vibrio superstes]|uniref:DDE-type integrase/transposase/recombinase n=1 Tax=Vibrio superstes TaxID=198815 RepID=UPI003530A02F